MPRSVMSGAFYFIKLSYWVSVYFLLWGGEHFFFFQQGLPLSIASPAQGRATSLTGLSIAIGRPWANHLYAAGERVSMATSFISFVNCSKTKCHATGTSAKPYCN
ncbi:MAG: hypothetical protein E6Q39_00935 [Crocinitomicaceae bacterium]|nr:MAG: hypothetical protein E6Q39_00935 [Crocinitomicaceae bacterium]